MVSKTTYNLKNGASLALDITKEMEPKGSVAKFFDRIFSNVVLGDERVKLTLELYSGLLGNYNAGHTVKLDTEKESGKIADTASNGDDIYHAASKIVDKFEDGLFRKDRRNVFTDHDTDNEMRQSFIVKELIREVLENETGIHAKCYCDPTV